MPEQKCHEFRVLLTNGSVLQLTSHELRSFIYSPRVRVLLVVSLLLIAMANPTLFPTLPVYTSRTFYWAISAILYVLVIPYWAETFSIFWQRQTSAALPVFLITAPLICLITGFAAYLPHLLGDLVPERGEPITVVGYLKNIAFGHAIEMTALLWLLPLHQNDQEQIENEVSSAQVARFVILNGKSIPLELVRSVKSAEHYLVVATTEKTSEYRARMKDFLAQVTHEDGIQIHRSFWVARHEALELDGTLVQTRSGETLPVSRGRYPAVKTWFNENGKPH